jgi:hypothetical protein
MSSEEPIERKADPEASLTEEDTSGTGDLLTSIPSLPTWGTVARVSLVVLLFGGLLSTVVGASLWTLDAWGVEATLAVVGVGAVVVAFVLAQVYARKGWI